MSRIVVLFNLKDGVDTADYENWALETDLPTVRNLRSVDDFSVLRSQGLLIGDGDAPYQYVEIIDVNDLETFGSEVSTETMQAVAAQFQAFAADPCFILTDTVG